MGLMITSTAPVAMTLCGLAVTGTMAKGVRTGDDTPFLGLVKWNHPNEMSSLIFYLGPNFNAQRALNRAQNQGGFEFEEEGSWITLFVTPLALETAFRALGLIV